MTAEEINHIVNPSGPDSKDTLYIPKMSFCPDAELGECYFICQGYIYFKADELGNTQIDSIDAIELAWIGVRKDGEFKNDIHNKNRLFMANYLSMDLLNDVKMCFLTRMKNSRYISSKDPSLIPRRISITLPIKCEKRS